MTSVDSSLSDFEEGGDARGDRARPRVVAAWLFVIAGLIVAMIVVGGLTRLTDSGLSITEWKPVTGVLPPMSADGWEAEFAKYREIPEYQFQNRGMSLDDFKQIYWWEWGHRLLGRVLGLAFIAPLAWFAWRRMLPNGFAPRLTILFVLGGLQGVVGWWMVASGLTERVDVSQYRLAAHLLLAFLLLGATWWIALDALSGGIKSWRPSAGVLAAVGVLALLVAQIALGAFVAGLDGGRTHTGWPLVDGRLVPETYGAFAGGFWGNAFDNPVAAQINHRFVGYAAFIATIGFAAASSGSRDGVVRNLAFALAAATTAQVALGVIALTHASALVPSAAHQLGAAAVFLVAVSLVRASGVSTTVQEGLHASR